ncbi:MAG TPA: M48 family metallopeptidase [Methylomirabilota bacterium]|nr:M48 family metallopeptidase [Methylomirabilota bacterium]
MSDTLRGNCFIEGQLRPGTLLFSERTLRFQADTGQALELPLEGVALRFGGHNDAQIYFENPAHPGVSIHTSDPRALDHPFFASPQHKPHIERFLKRQKRIPAVAYFFGAIVLFFLALIVALFLSKDAIVRWATDKIPLEWEQKLGDQVIRSVESRQPFVTDADRLSKLTTITNRLIPAAGAEGYSFRFYVVQDTNINAFAIPGGHVVIHTGLLDAASTKEEIAGVLAHEIAHVTERHSMRKIVESAGMFLLIQALLGDTEGIVKLISDSSSTLLQQKFSRDFEREADDKGWEFLLAARIDPRGLTSFFKRLLEEEKKRQAIGAAGAMSLLSTHPPTAERIERLESRWKQVPEPHNFQPL